MDNVRRYQNYRLRRRGPGRTIGRLVVIALVVVVLFWLYNGVRSSPKSSGLSEDTNIPPLVNGNVSANTNVAATSTSAAPAGAVTVAKCPGVVSQYGEQKRIALTFNGSGAKGSTEQIRDLLKQNNVPAAFFLTGQWIENNQELAKSLTDAGNGVYNYTYDKPHPAQLSAEDLTKQLAKSESLIAEATGQDPKPFFRPPYGEFSDEIIKTTRASGYCVIHWTVDSFDWQDGQTVEGAKQRVLDKAKPGAIVLMQIGSDVVTELLPGLMTDLRGRGYELVSLPTLLGS